MGEQPLSRILLVEDEKNLGSTLVERLQREGYEALWVNSREAALLLIEKRGVDLALLDVGLPDGSGFEVAQFLRERQPAAAVIFLTAFGNAEDRIRGLELGAE